MTRDYSDSEGEEPDEECEDTDDKSVTETHLLQVKTKKEKLVKKNTVAKATIQLKLRESRFLGVNRIKTFLFCCSSTI